MRKTYRYKDLTYPIADKTLANLTVDFISDGNRGQTTIDVPGNTDPSIKDSGTVLLGKGKDLRNDYTICFSSIENLVPEEDTIEIDYKINGTLIQKHINLKSEEERPIIVLKIKFSKP